MSYLVQPIYKKRTLGLLDTISKDSTVVCLKNEMCNVIMFAIILTIGNPDTNTITAVPYSDNISNITMPAIIMFVFTFNMLLVNEKLFFRTQKHLRLITYGLQ